MRLNHVQAQSTTSTSVTEIHIYDDKTALCIALRGTNGRSSLNSGSTGVVDFGTNRKRIYKFLLMINSNLGHVLHCFGDTAA